MSFFLLAPLFATIANLALAIFVFTRDARLRVNQVFFLWGFSLALWNFGAFAMFWVQTESAAWYWAHILSFGVVLIPVAVLHLSLLLAKVWARWWLVLAYSVTALLEVSNLTGYLISGVRHIGYAWYEEAGPGFWAFAATLPMMTIPAILVLMNYRHSLPPGQRRKFTVLIGAKIMLLVMGTQDTLPVLGITRYPGTDIIILPWGSLAAGMYGFAMAYSVLQDQLLDVRITLGRFAATLVRLMFLVGVAFLILFLAAAITGDFTMASFTAAIVAVAASALVTNYFFPKLLGRASEELEQRLLGDHFEYQEQLRAFGENMAVYNDQTELTDDLMAMLTTAMRITTAHVAVFDSRTGTRRFSATRPQQLSPHIPEKADNIICDYFRQSGQKSIDLRNRPIFDFWRASGTEARGLLGSLGAEYSFALGSRGEVIGYLAVGGKGEGKPFTLLDIELLLSLVAQLSQALDRLALVEQSQFAEKMELMAVMSRGLAHDLNNCITPVMTYLQLLGINGTRDPGEERLHQTAIDKMEVMRRYISEAIFFAQTLTPKYSRAGLASIVEAAREVAAGRCEAAGVTLDATEVEDLVVVADGILLQRMTANLIANAADASKPGGRIWIRASKLMVPAQRGPWFRLQVIDEGHGIDPEHIGKVFQPYFSTRDAGDGARGFGLGLTMCEKIVDLHRGVIKIESTLGKQTVVTADMPVDPREGAT
ncbi:MAG: ATP-binding protein [Opitutaceae bacterium]|jgi:signal transduction histidine kinase